MRFLASLVLLCAIGAIAAEKKVPAKTAPRKAATAKTVPQPPPLAIPAGAREVEPGIFLHVDAQGKRWNYRRTPFGVSRWEDKDEQADRTASSADAANLEATTAVEDGDLIRFSRPGPFGTYKWSRKKTELDAGEQAVWKRQQEQDEKTDERKPE
jgi:hypothetical protein